MTLPHSTKEATANTTKRPIPRALAKLIPIKSSIDAKSLPPTKASLTCRKVDVMKPLPRRPCPSQLAVKRSASQIDLTYRRVDVMKPLPRRPCPSSVLVVPLAFQHNRPSSPLKLISPLSDLEARSYELEAWLSTQHHSSPAEAVDLSSPSTTFCEREPVENSSDSSTPTLNTSTSSSSISSSRTSSAWSLKSTGILPISSFSTQGMAGLCRDKEDIENISPKYSFWTKQASPPPISPLSTRSVVEPNNKKVEVVGEIGATKEEMMEMTLKLAYVKLEIEQLWWRRMLLSGKDNLEGYEKAATFKVC